MIASGMATSTGQVGSDEHFAVEHGTGGILARLRAHERGDWSCPVHCHILLSRGRVIHDLTLQHGKPLSSHKHVICFFPPWLAPLGGASHRPFFQMLSWKIFIFRLSH